VDEDLVLEKVDNSYTITATVFPSNATNKNLTWTTSDESVATVDNGVITAVGPGTATITVTSVADSSKKATVHVVVGDILVPAIFADDPTLGTLQGEIDKAEPGSTIVVAPATYNEQLIINKPLTLLGPNADIAGAAEKRYPEAIIKGTGNGLSQLLEIDAENVEINGFTFDDTRIDNYNNTTGTNTNLIGGIAIVNNRFINTSGTAIYLRDGRNAPGEYSKDIQICNNKIETIISAGTDDYNAGSGIIVMGAEDLRICGNIISNAAYNGIQLARNKNATVTDNIVTDSEQPALQIAQWNEGVHEISGNTFSTKSEEKGAIRLYGFTNNYIPEFNISNNKIENSHYGIQIGHGDAGKSYNDIRDANYSLIGNIFDDISEHELIIYLNTEPSNEEAEEMNSLFKEVYGEEYSSKAKTNEDPFTYVVNILKVGEGKEFTTIQEAIDAAAAGDVIIVGDGEYTENLTINKAITLKSLNGRESTEIAGTITITADDVTVEGFTVTAQGYYAVPVIHMIDIDNVNILNNTVVADDTAYGAIGTSSAPAKITGKISGNTVTGMIMVGTDGAVEVSNNNVTLTTASTEGICFYPVGSTAEITVTGNTVGRVNEGNVQIKVNERPASVNEKTTAVEMLAAITADNNGATAKLAWLSDSIAVIGATGYLTLQAAIDAAVDGDTINILGDCTLIGATANNKDLTFVGNSSKPKIEFPQGKDQPNYQTYYGCEFTFENLTLQCEPDKNYQGIQPDKVIARNCVINGKFWGYAKDLEFTDCIFNQETSYNIWTYGSNVTFENCEFNSAGRSVLIYNEGATLAVPAEIIFKNCTFSASSSVDRKAAIDIDTRFGSFNVKIENCSASGFSNETEEGGTVISEGLVHLKATDKGELTVSIDDKLVYPTVLNATQNKGYNTIQAAVTAAQEGDTILIAAGTYDLTSTLTINKSITVQGIDKEEVILKGANSITNTIYLGNGATLKNVTVTRDNSGDWATNKNNQLINFYNSNDKTTTLEECIITGGRNGVYVNNKTDIVIKDNLIDNNRTGIQMANRNDATVENNIITNNHTMGVLLLEFESVGTGIPIFTGNEIRDNWYSDFENRWAAEYVVDLTNNTFTDGTYKVADTSGEPGYGDLRPVELGGLATRPEDRTTFIMKTAGNLILPSLD
jgi:parallel beta-helix repeat protein